MKNYLQVIKRLNIIWLISSILSLSAAAVFLFSLYDAFYLEFTPNNIPRREDTFRNLLIINFSGFFLFFVISIFSALKLKKEIKTMVWKTLKFLFVLSAAFIAGWYSHTLISKPTKEIVFQNFLGKYLQKASERDFVKYISLRDCRISVNEDSVEEQHSHWIGTCSAKIKDNIYYFSATYHKNGSLIYFDEEFK